MDDGPRTTWRAELRRLAGDDPLDFARIQPVYAGFLADTPAPDDFVELAEQAPTLIHRGDRTLTQLPGLRPVMEELLDARAQCFERLLTIDNVPDQIVDAMLAAREQLRRKPERERDDDLLRRMDEQLEPVRLATSTQRNAAIRAAFDQVGSHQTFTSARMARAGTAGLDRANTRYEAAIRLVVEACRAPALHLALVGQQQHGGPSLERSYDAALVGLRKAAYAYSPTRDYLFFTYAQWWVRHAIVKARIGTNEVGR